MKLENVLKLEKYCEHHDDSYCFTKDHDSLEGLTCQKCIHGNELVEQLLECNSELLEALKVLKGNDDFSYEIEHDGLMCWVCLFCGERDEDGGEKGEKHSHDCIKEKVKQAIAKAEEK